MRKSGFVFTLLVLILLLIPLVKSQAMSAPRFEKKPLLRGESTRFFFEVYSGSAEGETCTISVSGLEPLVVTLDEDRVIVSHKSPEKIFGTVSVPTDATPQTYKGTITLSCHPLVREGVGGSLVIRTLSGPFTVDVVERIEKRPTVVLPTPPPERYRLTPLGATLIIVLVIVIIAGIGYWYTRRREVSEF